MIDAAELEEYRAVQNEALPEQVDKIEDFGRVRDDSGGWTEGLTERAGPLPRCRIGNVTDSEARQFADQLAGRPTVALTLPAETPAEERDVIHAMGWRWRVVAVLAPESWETARRLLVERDGASGA